MKKKASHAPMRNIAYKMKLFFKVNILLNIKNSLLHKTFISSLYGYVSKIIFVFVPDLIICIFFFIFQVLKSYIFF